LEAFVRLILEAGKSAVDLALYVLLPIMVVMMALMKILEAKGVLRWVARLLSPVLKPFGIPGVGVFAMLQLLFVSFAAPVATLAIMETDGTPRRRIAATLAMILAMSQANAVFPMLAVGLNLPAILLTSLVGGIVASTMTYYVFLRSEQDDPVPAPTAAASEPRHAGALNTLLEGGQEGAVLVARSLPLLLLAIFLVKVLRTAGAIALLERLLSPLLETVGLTGVAVLPVVTKYLAGGTAMMGVAMDLVREGVMTAPALNRIAGFMINPLDIVGLAVLRLAGPRVGSVIRPAILGAGVGILVRAVLHLLLF
jgi:spore maturation protein SpmB